MRHVERLFTRVYRPGGLA